MAIRHAFDAPANGEHPIYGRREELIDPAKLRHLSLTPAEIRIARALFQGESVTAYAKKAGISINTARWHTKRIYAKANVHRQTALIYQLLKRPLQPGRTELCRV
jgi:DNA-binding CsgD family transcriptional regulator